jgi:hypothetical protein
VIQLALTTPILSPIVPFDSTKDYNVLFNVIGGLQVTKNNIVIVRVSDSVEIYNHEVSSFLYAHTIPANILANNVQYKIKVRTGDANNNYSVFSDWVLFYCYVPATISINNITSGGIANNQNYQFLGDYISSGDPIKSFIFVLYNENGIQLAVSPMVYSSTIQYTFTLENQKKYNIELKTISQSSVQVTTGLIPFTASYIAPQMGAELQLTNLSDQGAVDLSIIAIQRNATGSGYTLVDNDWIDLTAVSAIVRLIDGLDTLSNDYSLRLHFKNIPTNITFLKILSSYGNIQVKYYENRFHVFQTACGLVSHFINPVDITFLSTESICLELKVINGLIDVYAAKYV